MNHEVWPYTARLIDRLDDPRINNIPLTKMDHARSPGVHASELLRILHPVESGITEEELRIFGILGFAFEDRVERALISLTEEPDWPWEAQRAQEQVRDGIAGTPDILLFAKDNADPEPVKELSVKATWKSSTDAPDGIKFAYYNDQCMTYATPLDTLSSVLVVYFVNGNYFHMRKGSQGKPPVPQIKGWDLSFTARERHETWMALKQIAKGRT